MKKRSIFKSQTVKKILCAVLACLLFTSILPLQGYAAKSESINLQEDNVTENKETGNPPQLDISLNSSKEALEVNENSFEDFSYVLTVSLQNESQEVSDYAKEVFFDFKLTTPQSVSLPEETYIYDSENACIFAGEKPFMSFTGFLRTRKYSPRSKTETLFVSL